MYSIKRCNTDYDKDFMAVLKDIDIVAIDMHDKIYDVIDDIEQSNVHISIMTTSIDIISYVCRYTSLNVIIPEGHVDQNLRVIIPQQDHHRFEQYPIHVYLSSAPILKQGGQTYLDVERCSALQEFYYARAQSIYALSSVDIANRRGR